MIFTYSFCINRFFCSLGPLQRSIKAISYVTKGLDMALTGYHLALETLVRSKPDMLKPTKHFVGQSYRFLRTFNPYRPWKVIHGRLAGEVLEHGSFFWCRGLTGLHKSSASLSLRLCPCAPHDCTIVLFRVQISHPHVNHAKAPKAPDYNASCERNFS